MVGRQAVGAGTSYVLSQATGAFPLTGASGWALSFMEGQVMGEQTWGGVWVYVRVRIHPGVPTCAGAGRPRRIRSGTTATGVSHRQAGAVAAPHRQHLSSGVISTSGGPHNLGPDALLRDQD